MERIGADDIYQDLQDGCISWDNQYYSAPDVDALRAALRALVDASQKVIWFERERLKETCPGCMSGFENKDICSHGEEFSPIVQLLKQAIAASEAIISPQRSSPPPADTGKA